LDKTTAILINRHRLSETSLIVHWCSAEEGLFKTVAKGALRPKSAFTGQLDLFVSCEVVFVRSRKSNLHTLKEVQNLETRPHLRGSYARVLAASYFSRLVEMVAEQETPLGPLHEVLRLALDYLDQHDPTGKLVLRYENRLCQELGLGEVQRGAAALLQEFFHRALPPQRAELLRELKRLDTKESSSGHPGADFA
jgi:DNA repair protein RecO (recombination protein O)